MGAEAGAKSHSFSWRAGCLIGSEGEVALTGCAVTPETVADGVDEVRCIEEEARARQAKNGVGHYIRGHDYFEGYSRWLWKSARTVVGRLR